MRYADCRSRGLVALLVLAGLASATPADAWGFAGHRLTTRLATRTLPEPLRSLFEANVAFLAEHSVDPDLWRYAGREDEAPNHFLDLDAFGEYPFADLPRDEAAHIALHGEAARREGRVPWRAGEAFSDLVAALREGATERALRQAAVLAHYVEDAHVPLHAVVNYDGQRSGQWGIHSRWESRLLERFEAQLGHGVAPEPAQPVTQAVPFVFDVLLASFREAEGLLASDAELGGRSERRPADAEERYDDAYFSRLYELERERLTRRLGESATAVGSLWLGAWEVAGRPDLDASFRVAYVRGARKGALLSLDGASADVLDDAVARGVMPNLAALRRDGASGRAVTALPAKTAAGHAALFTGAWAPVNGIGGNGMPVPGASILEWNDGYSSTHLRAEPIWVSAARQGLDVAVASATQVHPFAPFHEERRFGGRFGWRLALFDGYQRLIARSRAFTQDDLPRQPARDWDGELPPHAGQVWEVAIPVAGARVDGLLFDDPSNAVVGLDSLLLTLDKRVAAGVTLEPAPPREDASAFGALELPLAAGRAVIHFRLFELSPDASRILLAHADPGILSTSREELDALAADLPGGFVGNGLSYEYASGRLGPTVVAGGDGSAEARYLESVALVARQFNRLNRALVERGSWDLLVTYLPYPDEMLHTWLGYVDARLDGHDPELARRVRPWLDRGLGMVDAYLGELRRMLPDDAVLAVAGDHGMIAANRGVSPNVALAEAGLLATRADGSVDLSRTRAMYFAGNSGYVLINHAGREGGIVAPGQVAEVAGAVRAALLGIRDPETGLAPVLDVRGPAPDDLQPAIGGPTGGDLYLSLAPGYVALSRLDGAAVTTRQPSGEHMLDPTRSEMHVAVAIAGPGVPTGADLGRIHLIDVAPTLCALLGLDPPADATGRIVPAALSR